MAPATGVVASGFVLAGGLSRRMGQDKALLRFEGAPLVERALAIVRECLLNGVPDLGSDRAYIVGRRPDLSRYAPVIEDRYEGRGPIGGIEAALASSQTDLNLFLPVDTPFVPSHFLKWMIARAMNSGAAATIPVIAGDAQPLIAVYGRRLLAGLTQAIEAGNLKTIDGVVRASRNHGGADLFRVEMTRPFFLSWRDTGGETNVEQWFMNFNTPDDLRSSLASAAS